MRVRRGRGPPGRRASERPFHKQISLVTCYEFGYGQPPSPSHLPLDSSTSLFSLGDLTSAQSQTDHRSPPSLFFQKSTQTIDIATSHLRRPVITSSRSRAQARSLTAIAYPQQPPRIATRLHTTYRENERGKGSSFGRVPAGCRHSHSANGQSGRREE